MDNWFGLLKEQIEANGGTAITPDTYSRVKVWSYQHSAYPLLGKKKDNDLNSSRYAVKPGSSHLDQCYCVLMRIAQGCGWDLQLRLRLTKVTVS